MASEFCPRCGQPRVGSLRFCRSCGFDFDAPRSQEEQTTPPPQAPVPEQFWLGPKAESQPPVPSRLPPEPLLRGRTKWGCVAVLAFVIGFPALLAFVYGGKGAPSGSSGESDNRQSLTGEFLRWEPVDDSRGYAYFTITNHGSTPATAKCTIRVSNDFGDFGFDFLVGEDVRPGQTINRKIPISVGKGSFLINEGEVSDC